MSTVERERARPSVDRLRARFREDTPGCTRSTHFNAAGASLPARTTTDAVRAHLDREAEIGGYEAEAMAASALSAAYASLAALLGASAGEVAFCDSGSRAFAMAASAVALRSGDRILVTDAEYPGNFVALRRLADRAGAQVDVVRHRADGTLDVDELAGAIDDRVRIISIVHVPSTNGMILPIEAVARLDRKDALLFVDACQSFGQLPIDVRALGCDVLVASGRKFLRAPRGTAILYAAASALPRLEPRILDTYSSDLSVPHSAPFGSARRFETWESNVAAKLGLGAAARYLLDIGVEAVSPMIAALAEQLRVKLATLRGVRVLDLGDRRCGLVTFAAERISTEALWEQLGKAGFATDIAVLEGTLLERHSPSTPKAVRASVHYYNTVDEVEQFVECVDRLSRRCVEALATAAPPR